MNRCWRQSMLVVSVLAVIGATAGCRQKTSSGNSGVANTAVPLRFERVTQIAGIDFQHRDGSSGRKYFPEVMGPGCAFADFTGDGRPDIYLVNGAPLPGDSAASYRNRFYRNKGDGTFVDETVISGLGNEGYGIGCCAGDFNGDGLLDLYVTNLGPNALYQNNGDGTFTDVAAAVGVQATGFSTGAAFADYDGDGHLDLYVCAYVEWSPETNVTCESPDGQNLVTVYCRPLVYPAARNVLYHNNGNGAFTDVTATAGMQVRPGRSLGCLWTDIDNDGDLDLYVANDGTANFLFVNQGQGRFVEEAVGRGVAFGERGEPQASMGVAAADFDGDGWMDLAVTNFSGEYANLYQNAGGGQFTDGSAMTGVRAATFPFVGFGIGLPDLDLDGWPDMFVVNGHVTAAAEQFYVGTNLKQPNLCLRGDGQRFLPFPDLGTAVTNAEVSRGLACADYDGDGDLDLLVMNWRGEPDLLRNDSPDAGNWLRISLQNDVASSPVIGARVSVTAAGRTQVQEVRSGGSYCSQSEFVLTFGLGGATQAETVRVQWPEGRENVWHDLTAGLTHPLRRRQ